MTNLKIIEHIIGIFENTSQYQNSHFDTLDQKAQQAIGIGGIVIALIAAASFNQITSVIEKIIIIIILILFIFSLWFSLNSLRLRDWARPLNLKNHKNYKELTKNWIESTTPEEYFTQVVDIYDSIISYNDKVLNEKGTLTKRSLLFVYIEIGITCLFIFGKIIGF